MSKKKKDKLDPNVRDFLEEIERKAKQKETEQKEEPLKEGEYVICPGCGEKISKKTGVCAACGVKVKTWTYTPISEKKARIIRIISGIILVAAFFLVWFLVIDK